MIYKVEQFLSDEGKEIKVLTNTENEKDVKYTTPVPVLHPEMGIMEASAVIKVSSLKEAFDRIDSLREEYIKMMEMQADKMKNQLVIANDVPNISNKAGKLII
jgi:hypothetical protein